jgi:hypothetical protein
VLKHYKTCEEIEIFYRIVAQLLHGVGSEIRNDVGGRQPNSSSDVSICTFVREFLLGDPAAPQMSDQVSEFVLLYQSKQEN